MKHYNPKNPVKDKVGLRHNAYRVLLSRGRDGLVVFIPPAGILDATEHALLAAGLRPLEQEPTKPLQTRA